jgi:hypothetical protein
VGPEGEQGMLTMIKRLHTAMNQHDLEAMLECFDPEYRSEQPLHPNRGFGGKAQVRKNWSRMLDGFPDFEAQLLEHASSGERRGASGGGVPRG